MNRKIAAVLLAATMLTTPALAASVDSSTNTPTAQVVTPDKATTKDKGLKKHRVHARASHGHKVHHAKYTKTSHTKQANTISKKNVAPTTKKSDTKAVAIAPEKAPAKN